MSNPQEHFLWALRNLPSFAGTGMVTHSGFLRKWSDHLWHCGFAHRDYLAGLADSDGNIHVSQLPKPFQINAITDRDWTLDSDWKRFTVSGEGAR